MKEVAMHFSQNIEWALPILFILIIIIEQFIKSACRLIIARFSSTKNNQMVTAPWWNYDIGLLDHVYRYGRIRDS